MNLFAVEQLDPKKIERPPQARTEFDDAQADAELDETIRAVGIIQPLLVRRHGDRLIVLDGERRLRSSLRLNLQTVPALIVDRDIDPAERVQLQLIANCVRKNLSPLEQARALEQLMQSSGCTAAVAAKKIGRSPATVSKLLSLLTLSADQQSKVASGAIGLAEGHRLARAKPVADEANHSSSKQSKQRFTAMLDPMRSITVTTGESTLDAFMSALDELIVKARSARKQGIELSTFLAMLKDQARA